MQKNNYYVFLNLYTGVYIYKNTHESRSTAGWFWRVIHQGLQTNWEIYKLSSNTKKIEGEELNLLNLCTNVCTKKREEHKKGKLLLYFCTGATFNGNCCRSCVEPFLATWVVRHNQTGLLQSAEKCYSLDVLEHCFWKPICTQYLSNSSPNYMFFSNIVLQKHPLEKITGHLW